MVSAVGVIGIVVAVLVVLFVVVAIARSVIVVREREVVIVQRWGKFKAELHAGFHFLVPFMDRPKVYRTRVWVTDSHGVHSVEVSNSSRISLQSEVMDFPKQNVITRDNASVLLDVVLSYKITDPARMVYSCVNLPNILSKLLQAQVRNVAGTLDIDQIIEEAQSLNVLGGLMDAEAQRWGVKILFVKIQNVEARDLNDYLERKKSASLENKEVIIQAKAYKQTRIIESEGERDSMIRTAEGRAQQVIANAKGDAMAMVNAAQAEAKSLSEVIRALHKYNENPAQYLLALKYLTAIGDIVKAPAGTTDVRMIPPATSTLFAAKRMGMNVIFPSSSSSSGTRGSGARQR